MKVLVLLSGGLDSAVVLARMRGQERSAVGFDYGQPHAIELDYAARLAQAEGVPFERVALPVIPLMDEVVFAARNAILISVVVGMAMTRRYDAIALGCNAGDWHRFPDCRPAFANGIGATLSEAYGIHVMFPLLRTSKREIAEEAKRLGIGATWSCYMPAADGTPCGTCLACETRTAAGA